MDRRARSAGALTLVTVTSPSCQMRAYAGKPASDGSGSSVAKSFLRRAGFGGWQHVTLRVPKSTAARRERRSPQGDCRLFHRSRNHSDQPLYFRCRTLARRLRGWAGARVESKFQGRIGVGPEGCILIKFRGRAGGRGGADARARSRRAAMRAPGSRWSRPRGSPSVPAPAEHTSRCRCRRVPRPPPAAIPVSAARPPGRPTATGLSRARRVRRKSPKRRTRP